MTSRKNYFFQIKQDNFLINRKCKKQMSFQTNSLFVKLLPISALATT